MSGSGRQVDAANEQRRIRAGRLLVEAEIHFLIEHGWRHNETTLTWSHPSIRHDLTSRTFSLWQAVSHQKKLLSDSYLSALQRALEKNPLP